MGLPFLPVLPFRAYAGHSGIQGLHPGAPVLGFFLALGFVCTTLSIPPSEMTRDPEFLSLPAHSSSPKPLKFLIC